MTAATPLVVAFPAPQWLNKRIFSIRDAADISGAKASTITHWSDIAEARNQPLKVRDDSRIFYSGHAIYVVAILAELAKAGVSASVPVIGAVLDGTKDRLPGLGDRLVLHDGPAVVEVELSTVWIEVEPKLSAKAPYRP